MADKDMLALKRLTKKLNALRKTLRADERSFLDRMILGNEAAAEVAAHRFNPKAAGKASEAAAHRFSPKASGRASEVVAHKMSPKATEQAAEVVAHKMSPKASGASRPMISFDPMSGNYVATEEEPEVEGHLLKPAVALKVTPKAAP